MVTLFHVAPAIARESIERHGLDSSRWPGGLSGVYLWPTLELAERYTDDIPGLSPAEVAVLAAGAGGGPQDIWRVQVDVGELRPGGPYSTHPREVWSPAPIPAWACHCLVAGRA